MSRPDCVPTELDRVIELIEAHGAYLQRFLLLRGASTADVEDLLQETFMVFWKRHKQADAGKERAFLTGITRRVLMAHKRKSRVRRAILGEHGAAIARMLHSGPTPPWRPLVEREKTHCGRSCGVDTGGPGYGGFGRPCLAARVAADDCFR